MAQTQRGPAHGADRGEAGIAQLAGESGGENRPGNGDAQDVLIGDLQKNRREIVRVQLREFKGVDLVDVRVHYPADGGEYRATGKGVSIKPELLPDLIELLQQAEQEARRRGLL